MKKIFVSYRRQDSGTIARRLADACGERYGRRNVFIDTDSIRVGANWSEQIQAALNTSEILIAVIGPKWIHTHDQDGRRRIDNAEDWVRNEISHAISARKQVVPVLVQGAPALEAHALPDGLKEICAIQNYELSDRYWVRDIDYLLSQLDSLGMTIAKANADLTYPPRFDHSVPLSDSDVERELEGMEGWVLCEDNRAIHAEKRNVKEIRKTFEFQSFSDCIHFINTASRHIVTIDHHPRWENLWVSLTVSLSGWDIGGVPTYKDMRLAKYLDELFIAYKKKSEA